MSSNEARATTLVRALRAGIEQDRRALEMVYTDDVRAWTPVFSTGSLADLVKEFDRRDDAFSDIDLEAAPLDVGGDYACVEWSVAMTHTGQVALAGGATIEPTGTRVTFHGVTVAEFRGEQICSFRQYWDEFEVLEQLGVGAGAG
jgi:ketosteroid isomerase-like protein